MNMHFADRLRSRSQWSRRGRGSRNYPRISLLSLAGTIGVAGLGYLVWRMASGKSEEGETKQPAQGSQTSSSGRWWQNLLPHMSEASRIDSLEALYVAELQELRHADGELTALLSRLAKAAHNDELAKRLRRHEGKIEVQRRRISEIIQQCGASARTHKDDAMRALEAEAHKMLKIRGDASLRDAAIIASFQRIVHYRIATLGTIAAYAQLLGRNAEASEFAEWSDAEGKLDHDLTELAEATINRTAKQEGV